MKLNPQIYIAAAEILLEHKDHCCCWAIWIALGPLNKGRSLDDLHPAIAIFNELFNDSGKDYYFSSLDEDRLDPNNLQDREHRIIALLTMAELVITNSL